MTHYLRPAASFVNLNACRALATFEGHAQLATWRHPYSGLSPDLTDNLLIQSWRATSTSEAPPQTAQMRSAPASLGGHSSMAPLRGG